MYSISHTVATASTFSKIKCLYRSIFILVSTYAIYFAHKTMIICQEGFATCRYVLPNTIKWYYRLFIKKQIASYRLQKTFNQTTKKARLFSHSALHTHAGQTVSAVLLLHGDYGHPYTMLHLADSVHQSVCGPVFSLHLPYDKSRKAHLLKQVG